MNSKEKNKRLILKSLCLAQALIETLDEVETTDMYITNFKMKTKSYKNLLENILKQQMDTLYFIDEDIMLKIGKHLDKFSEHITNSSLEELTKDI